ncbi:MAG: hypothetical protein JO048_04140 [Methylobacteriaceae bacterium]|nr:hypothetical protein [Methylobacteriaceae bacterium]
MGLEVERINQFRFYNLGRTLKAFAELQGPVLPARAAVELLNAQQTIGELLQGDPIQLGLSRRPAEALLNVLNMIFNQHYADENGAFHWPEDNAPPILEYQMAWYRNSLVAFETVFFEEMRAAATYIVPVRGLYDIPSLVDCADKMIPAEVIEHIPDQAKEDWRAAGRCLACILPSASGFHVARAIESVVEAYYKAFVGCRPPSGSSWGDLIADLEKVSQNPVPQAKTLAILRQIKDDWRNPVVHPRVTLTLTDAEVLFALGASVMMSVAQELKALSASGVQPSLTLVAPSGAVF